MSDTLSNTTTYEAIKKFIYLFIALFFLFPATAIGGPGLFGGSTSSSDNQVNDALGDSYDTSAELDTLFDARCLESVFGTAIGSSLLLTTGTLSASTILQKYHAIDPADDVELLLACADEAAIRTLLDLEVGVDFEVDLGNEAGLYAVLSDVANFLQDNEKFTGQVTVQEFAEDHTTPDVSNAALGVNNVYQTNAANPITITDFDDGDGAAHDEFADGDWFILLLDDSDTTIDFSANANIEGNAAVDLTGLITQPVYLLFIYESARWNCVNFTSGYSDPTTLAISAISGAMNVNVTGLLSGGVVTKVTGSAYTVGATNAAEAYGGVIYVTGAAVITYPAVLAGMHFTIITVGDVAVSGKPATDDLQYLDGTALDDLDKVTNTSGTGDIIVVTYYDGTGWWTISGSNDGDPWTDTGA